MTKFRVELNGSSFLIDMEGTIAKHGFITVRFVEAADGNTALREALSLMTSNNNLRITIKNEEDDPPVMDVTSVTEVESFEMQEDHQPGLIWYEENPRRWWQFWKR